MQPTMECVSRVVLVALLLVPSSTGCRQSEPGPRPPEATSIEKFQIGLRRSGIWSGGPGDRFEGVGRNTLAAMIKYGLMPEHKVLDAGAGSLRVGWWLPWPEGRLFLATVPYRRVGDKSLATHTSANRPDRVSRLSAFPRK